MTEPVHLDLDFGAETEDDFDTVDESKGKLEPGWYLAMYDGASMDEQTNIDLKFTIICPDEHQGSSRRLRLWNNDNENNVKRIKAIAKRLGLVSKDDMGTTKTVDWNAPAGETFAIRLVHKWNKEQKKNFVEFDWLGVYRPDHPEVDHSVRVVDPGFAPRGEPKKQESYEDMADKI